MMPVSISLLTICGLEELEQHRARGVTHVLSILDPDWPDPQALLADAAVHSIGSRRPLRDELLRGEIFYSLRWAEVLIEVWRRQSNTAARTPLGYRPPAPETMPCPAAQSRPAPPATPAVAPNPIMH